MSSPKVEKTDAEWREQLAPDQYAVLREASTERPFTGKYVDVKDDGVYRCAGCGAELFDSGTKFESGTGWPSFTQPLEAENVVTKTDRKFFMNRTEARSKHGDSHLGHVFPDGPPPTGQRYCMNSASLRFIPVEKLEAEGYGRYLPLFQKQETHK
jgi:methionine-R-sulfoxide reductase